MWYLAQPAIAESIWPSAILFRGQDCRLEPGAARLLATS